MADVWLTFGISQNSQSIPNNTSNVTVTVYANWRYGYYNKNNKSGTLTIDGTSYSFSAPFNTGVASSGSSTLVSKTVNVAHGSNGAKTLSVSASYTTGVVGTVSGSTSKVLTTIPRVSDLSVNKTSVPADGNTTVTATATKKSTSFTDVLIVTLGDYSQEVESDVAFSIPMEWINAILGTSAKATVKVETFNGSTSIGSKTVELTITVPESVVPAINDIGITEAVTAVTDAFGALFVQNLSQLNVSINASGVYGSTIRSYSATLDGVNYIQQAFTSNVIKTAGKLAIKVKVTDSRGRSAEDTVTVDIVEYIKPTITSMVYIHCNSDGTPNSSGTSTKVTIAGKVYPVANQNTKALKLKYKAMADEVYTEMVVTISNWTFSADVIINNTDPTVTYEYIAELTDKINTASPETFRVTTGIVVLSRKAGGTGVTIGGEAERDGFVVANGWDALFTGNLFIELDDETLALWEEVFGTSGGAVNLLDLVFHKGYVIPTTNSKFDPNTIFPWMTWERFAKGRTLVGVDEDDTDFASAGLELGEKEHQLKESEIPSHVGHLYTNDGAAFGGNAKGLYLKSSTMGSYGSDPRGWMHSGGEMLPAGTNRGGDQPHNNIQPSTTVYYWRRVS